MKSVLVTGAGGFIGSELLPLLADSDWQITVSSRSIVGSPSQSFKQATLVEPFENADWSNALKGVDCVLHLAGRAHILTREVGNSLDLFRKVNTVGTLNLAEQAAKAGVKRFVFMSSIGVNGGETFLRPFTAESIPSPTTPYAISKYEAEVALSRVSASFGMEFVIIRPPMVYGACAPGNFNVLIRSLARGVPLPLAFINNKRSFIAIENLVSLVIKCLDHSAAANQVLLASDDEDVSTTEFLRKLINSLGNSSRLFPVPSFMLETALKLVGKEAVAQSLCGNLQLDICKTKQLLNWEPPLSLEKALSVTAESWLKRNS